MIDEKAYRVCFHPFNANVIAVSTKFEFTVRVWNVQTQKCIRTIRGLGGFINTTCFIPCDTRIVTLTEGPKKAVRVWDEIS